MLEINLTGPILCIEAVAPYMVKYGSGTIINICSTASYQGQPNYCAYVAAKTSLLGLTRAPPPILLAAISGSTLTHRD